MEATTSAGTGSSKKKLATISLFGGINLGQPTLLAPVVQAGTTLGDRKCKLIYGGGLRGLIGCAVQSAYVRGSTVVGVTVPPLKQAYGKTIGCEVNARSLFERLTLMIMHSDAFIALPGGFETLEQIFCIISWAELNLHSKPIGLLNVQNHFNGLLAFLEFLVHQKLISPNAQKMILVAPSIEELLEKLEAYVPPMNVKFSLINWPEELRKRRKDPNELDLELRL